jgi:hypothetical protein
MFRPNLSIRITTIRTHVVPPRARASVSGQFVAGYGRFAFPRRLGLRNVEASDAATLSAYFATLAEPLSDYTFSQIFTWRNSLRLLWRELHGHLCVFANGAGDLTLLLPPIGYGDAPRALSAAFELMDDYNAQHHVEGRSRIEYASEELLTRLDPSRSRLSVESMGHDYVYDAQRMIDLAGGDLASKRQAKNRFIRNYGHRVETYDAARYLPACLELLGSWNDQQSEHHAEAPTINAIKRQKELLATELALKHANDLGLVGMVVHVAGDDGVERIGGFTLGERLGKDQSSIVIEKTDLRMKGLAQFIFSEFVRQHWSDRPLVNVGDDWGLPTLGVDEAVVPSGEAAEEVRASAGTHRDERDGILARTGHRAYGAR